MTLENELELQLKREVYKANYFEFFKWAFSKLMPNEKYEDSFHIKYLCDLYQAEVERIIRKEEKDQDLIVNIPPRTSKSLITSVCLLVWAWINDPTIAMIAVSFDEELTLLNAQYCKDIIKDEEFQLLFGDIFQIRKDANAKGFFMNDKGGFRMSKTTGENITGHKGLLIVVDDPQSPKTAESEVHRKTTIEYYTRSLYNRLTPPNLGIRIIIMQRLHELDLTGYLLKKNPLQYKHICLPAEESLLVLPVELKAKYINGLLDPVRLNPKILTGFKDTLGTRGYTGQYEQRPSPEEGGIFKKAWFDIVEPESIVRDVINEPVHFFVDSAYTEKTSNDPSAILTCFKKANSNILYIVDVKVVRKEFPDLVKFIIEHTTTYQLGNDSRIYIEPKASGKSVAQQLRASTMLNVVETKAPDTDKVTRANAVSPVCESRRVKLIRGAYIQPFLEELTAFNNAAHDDQVDTLVMALDQLLIDTNPDYIFA